MGICTESAVVMGKGMGMVCCSGNGYGLLLPILLSLALLVSTVLSLVSVCCHH